jgi:hypothetical protein
MMGLAACARYSEHSGPGDGPDGGKVSGRDAPTVTLRGLAGRSGLHLFLWVREKHGAKCGRGRRYTPPPEKIKRDSDNSGRQRWARFVATGAAQIDTVFCFFSN